MNQTTVILRGDRGSRTATLADFLDPAAEERAIAAAHHWIKQLRLAEIDGEPLRRRFSIRGDSLWWFAELYLHKQQVMLEAFRALAALERMVETEAPRSLTLAAAGRVTRTVGRAFAAARGIPIDGVAPAAAESVRIARMSARAALLNTAALASRLRQRGRHEPRPAGLAAFVHRAFWRGEGDAGEAESYIGPVLTALEERLPPGALRYVGVGPATNFRARRWWHPLRGGGARVDPVESFAPLDALRDARAAWRLRHAHRRALWSSRDVRSHAVIAGCDCWPLVREELAGIALLQWPWSVRAMDEAGAALDALAPAVALTYAEAGGWGRAIILEARRRQIPSVGLQHGFIYRHWLNYLHEADEMVPDPAQPADRGFPYPTRTLLFDLHAAEHLVTAGRFPAGAVEVTGSPRLDALVAAAGRLDGARIEAARAAAGAAPTQALAVLFTKYREARHVLPALVDAVGRMPDVQLAIKTHPAETPEAYSAIAARATNVRIVPADAPLPPLLRAARAIVTVNSTVALDAAVLGVPALVIGLPNNLTPFVEAGAMAGAAAGDDIGSRLREILYDEQFRLQLDRKRSACLTRYAIGSDGRAAERSADAVLRLFNTTTGD